MLEYVCCVTAKFKLGRICMSRVLPLVLRWNGKLGLKIAVQVRDAVCSHRRVAVRFRQNERT